MTASCWTAAKRSRPPLIVPPPFWGESRHVFVAHTVGSFDQWTLGEFMEKLAERHREKTTWTKMFRSLRARHDEDLSALPAVVLSCTCP